MAIESTTQQSTPIKSAKKKTSRRRRRKTTVPAADADGNVALPTETPPAKKVAQVDVAEVASETVRSGETGAEAGGAGGRTRGRRGGRSRRTSKKPAATASTTEAVESASESEAPTPTDASKTTPRRRKPASRGEAESSAAQTEPASETASETGTSETAPPKRRSRGRRGGKKSKKTRSAAELESQAQTHADDEGPSAAVGTVEELLASDLSIEPFTETPGGKTRDRQPAGGREMIINVSPGYECRIAVLHEQRLEELFIERDSTQSHVGNIYKATITNVESSIQAAFVDFGLPKNGFLHISDVQPQYFPGHTGGSEDVGRKIPRHNRPPIQKCFRRGQEVIVQIIKEGVGTKGPTLTSYLSIPGRFLVMMPGMTKHGVSRKIEDEAERRKMRDVLNELKLPSGMGFILRTAGLGRPKRDLQRDLNYLLRLWKTVVECIKSPETPAELYRESDLVTRTIRDVYTTDFSRIVVDDAATAKKAREFLQIAMPRTKARLELYTDRQPLFHRLGIESEIEEINMRQVPLPSGGSLVIESTEALVAIDVNSGKFRSPGDAEETAFLVNVEAAKEIARQLRLRDLGGLIVCDFIDMRLDHNKRKVEQALRDALKDHKERARILKTSGFGLIEMTRQRQGPSIKRNIYSDCLHCQGTGLVKMPESVMLDAMRMIQLAVHHKDVSNVTITLASDVAFQLLNDKRGTLQRIEDETGKAVVIRGDATFTGGQMEVRCEDDREREVAIGATG